ncbi:MAG: BON domain-containing protein [Planctomycetota bacterium]
MRRFLVGLVVAAVTVLVPLGAMAGNQEVAEQIAANLRNSGQLKSYKVGVKYQDGTAWLRGRVNDQKQMNAALRVVFQTPGVTRVVNDLTIGSADKPAEAAMPPVKQASGAVYPERIARLASRGLSTPAQRVETGPRPAGHADRVATTFASTPAQKVAVMTTQEPMPAPQPQTLMAPRPTLAAQSQPMAVPVPIAYVQAGPMPMGQAGGGPIPQYVSPVGGGVAPAQYDQPYMPNYTWPSYAAYPNYAALTYPKQYSPTAWPYIGPFYPYPQVPLGWRKVSLEWHDGWWQLDFDDGPRRGPISGLFRPHK